MPLQTQAAWARSVSRPLVGMHSQEGTQMTIKKMLLLASMALAAVAFAAPATASAVDVWTADGDTLGPGNEATAGFEGFINFTTPPPAVPVHSSFGCQVTVAIKAVGEAGGTVESFNPTTDTCQGTGIFVNCKLKEDTSNPPWNISIASTPGTVSGPITIHYIYQDCPVTTSHIVFASISVAPNVINGDLTFTVGGLATNGFTTVSGAISQETEDGHTVDGQPLLGIETKQP